MDISINLNYVVVIISSWILYQINDNEFRISTHANKWQQVELTFFSSFSFEIYSSHFLIELSILYFNNNKYIQKSIQYKYLINYRLESILFSLCLSLSNFFFWSFNILLIIKIRMCTCVGFMVYGEFDVGGFWSIKE